MRPPLLLWAACAVAAAGGTGQEATGRCAVASGLCGPSGGAYHWPTQKGGLDRTGFSPHPVPDLTKGPAWMWFDPFSDVVRATPLIDDKRNIYLTTVGGRIYKFNRIGVIIWEKRLDVGIPTVGALYNGSLFAGTKSGQLLSLSMDSGEEQWQATVSTVGVTAHDPSSIFVLDGIVVLATHTSSDTEQGNSAVVAVTAEDGRPLWRYYPAQRTIGLQVCSPGDDTIVFQDKVGGLYRLGLRDGRQVWRSGRIGAKWADTHTTGAAVCHAGKVFVVSNEQGSGSVHAGGALHVYSVEDGKRLWQVYLIHPANQAVAVGPHPTEKGKHVAVVGMGANPGRPAILEGTHHLGYWGGVLIHQVDTYFPWVFDTRASALAAYDTETGRRLWHFDLEPFPRHTALGDTERIRQRHADMFTGANPYNDIMCLPASCAQPVIGPDGTAYVGWQDGRVYAVRDANGDGRIDPQAEVSWHQFSDGFQGSVGLAPGMLVAAPCGGGLHVFTA